MTRILLMSLALAAIILVRFISDQMAIKRLAKQSGLNAVQTRMIFRSEIYNAMAANKLIALLFLAAIGYAIFLFFRLPHPERILMPILTVILAMEIGRYVTRKDADIKIAERLRNRDHSNANTTELQ